MTKIMKLTAEQEAELPAFRQKYLDIACTGGRANRDKLQAAVNEAYAVIGKPAPTLLIMPSSASSMLALSALKHLTGDRGQLRDQLGGQLGGQKISNQPAWDPNFLWGAQDLYWIAWARFAQKIGVKLRPETDRRLGIMERIAFQCEWWWPYDGLCVVSERPLFVKWDNERRLHCETGAAVEYADGYSLYAWRGIRIPSEWIAKGPPEAERIMRIENIEQRKTAAALKAVGL